MKYIEIQRAFESGTNSIDEVSNRKISSDDIFHWVNLGLDKFVADRMPSSIQSNQVFTDDLSTLIVSDTFVPGDYRFNNSDPKNVIIDYKGNKDNAATSESANIITEDDFILETEDGNLFSTEESSYESIRNTYLHAVGENVEITIPITLVTKIVDVLECTIENITSRLNNTLSEHRLNRTSARPLRVFTDNKIHLYTDGNYDISSYELIYVKKPDYIIMNDNNAFNEYIGMPDYTHKEIIDNGIVLYIQSLQFNNSKKTQGA